MHNTILISFWIISHSSVVYVLQCRLQNRKQFTCSHGVCLAMSPAESQTIHMFTWCVSCSVAGRIANNSHVHMVCVLQCRRQNRKRFTCSHGVCLAVSPAESQTIHMFTWCVSCSVAGRLENEIKKWLVSRKQRHFSLRPAVCVSFIIQINFITEVGRKRENRRRVGTRERGMDK